MCSACAERDVPFGRDVDFVSDVRFAREAEHITSLCAAGAIHHYAERHSITAAKPQLHFSTLNFFEILQMHFGHFRVCRQIQIGTHPIL